MTLLLSANVRLVARSLQRSLRDKRGHPIVSRLQVMDRRLRCRPLLLGVLVLLVLATSCGDTPNAAADKDQGSLYRIVVELEPQDGSMAGQIRANELAQAVLDSISIPDRGGFSLLPSISGYTNPGDAQLWIDFWPNADVAAPQRSTAAEREEVRRTVVEQRGVVQVELASR